MIFYEVYYWDDDSKDGCPSRFFHSKREARAFAAGLTREWKQASRKFQEIIDGRAEFGSYPDPGIDPNPTIKRVEFTGTPREMVFAALQYLGEP